MIARIQDEQKKWQEYNFPGSGANEAFKGIVEEIGELAHADLKETQGIRVDEDHIENAKDAIGDIVIYLMSYCNYRGFDLQSIIKDTWEDVKERDWQKNKQIPKDTKFKM
jgi:NTP pyrophosphatase (non-canonical NTP hydrolase)